MARYAKVFDSIWERSLRGKSDAILVFINMLTHADAQGVVNRHWQTIIDETGLSQEKVLAAIALLESPDPESNTPADEGRRIRRLAETRSWGWEIVNHAFYRDLLSKADNAERQKRWRIRNAGVTDSNETITSIPDGDVVSGVASSPEGGTGGTWRDSFAVYQAEELAAYDALRQDESWQAGRQKYHPNLDILLSLEKAHVDFWGTEAGWAWKKKSRSARSLNWKSTFATSLSLKGNQVWKDRNVQAERSKSPNDYRTIMDACKRGMERIQGTANWQDRPELVAEYQELRNNKVAADKALAKMGGKYNV